MRMTVFGSRGSMPSPQRNKTIYGGNTSCYLVELAQGYPLILDAGSGIVDVGDYLLSQHMMQADLYLSHLHLDHILGLPLFAPLFSPHFQLRIFGEERQGATLPQQLKHIFGNPYWPIGPDNFTAQITYHSFSPGLIWKKEGVSIWAERSAHPNQCCSFKITEYEKSLVYALDYEHFSESAENLKKFCDHSNLLVYDSQYLEEEYATKIGWGHSTWEQGVLLAQKSSVKQILFAHHAPSRTDEQIFQLEQKAQLLFPHSSFARDGQMIDL